MSFIPYQKKVFLVPESMLSMAAIHTKIKVDGECQIRIALLLALFLLIIRCVFNSARINLGNVTTIVVILLPNSFLESAITFALIFVIIMLFLELFLLNLLLEY